MMSLPRPGLALGIFCAALAAGAYPVSAASIPYGNFGPDFPPGITMYLDVTESSVTDPVPLYNSPSLSGNTLDFTPTSFGAFGMNGSGDITDGQLNFDLMVLEFNNVVAGGITSLLISESGDFTLDGIGTASTRVGSALSARIRILEVDGSAITPIDLFDSVAITRNLIADGPVMLAPWDNALLIDFALVLAGNNIDFEFGVTKAEVVINDQLLAATEPESMAFIAKKDFTLTPGSTDNPNFEIPEPASAVLLMTALAWVSLWRRRVPGNA